MSSQDKSEAIKKSIYISAIPGNGRLEIYYRGRKIAERVGEGEIKYY